MRALLDLVITVLVIMVARAMLTSLLRGVGNAARNAAAATAPSGQSPGESSRTSTGELHKDPVCGTYVAGSTALRQQINGHTFYYCSETCREKHTLVKAH